jgi:protein RecA
MAAKVAPALGNSSKIDDILNSLQDDLVKEFGAAAAGRLDSAMTLSRVDHWVSSRSLVVDKVLAGGRPHPCSLVPFGRQIEISGLPGSGKTTLVAQIAAEVQRTGGLVVVTDTEERIDHPYWSALGVDTNRILNLTADTLEMVFEKQIRAIDLMKKRSPDTPLLMIWDSVGGTSLESLVDFEETDASKKMSVMEAAKKMMANKARVIGNGIEVVNTKISKSRVCYLYTNHLYTKIGTSYGDPFETPGGNKLKYFATVRLRLHAVGNLSEEDEKTGIKKIYGQKVQVTALKNSMAPMRLSMEAAIIENRGYCNEYTVRELAESMKIITKAGAWSTCKMPSGDEVKYQGWVGFLEKVVEHAEYKDLYAQVCGAL